MKILIAGGSGLVGSYLTKLLHQKGHTVRHLSRRKYQHPIAEIFTWDLNASKIEAGAFDGIDAVVNLAGTGVAEGRWTSKQKASILSSRVNSVKCLYKNIALLKEKPKVIVTASGKDYYGDLPFDDIAKEDDPAGSTFLANVCKEWEAEARKFEQLDIRSVQVRIGVVLDKNQGALAELAKPIKLLVGAPLGTGRQIMSWIHVQDLSRMILHLIQTESAVGPYNGVGVNDATNASLTKAVARKLKKPLWLPNVPEFVLKLVLGEMATIVLNGNHVSSQKILDTGFKFEFEQLDDALSEIYGLD